MQYKKIKQGKFLERPNRFIAYIDLDGKKETVHVKNTGRCAELLKEGAVVYVQESDNPNRKTRWDLIGAEKGSRMINMDSQAPNQVVKEFLEAGNLITGITRLQPEFTWGNSRFDFYAEAESGRKRKIFIEVKGVTLEEEGRVRFPDAPSERAVKHVEELIEAVRQGYEAYVFFVIQMKDVDYFMPNYDTHPEFGEALKRAVQAGVKVIAYDCRVTENVLEIAEEVPVALDEESVTEQEALRVLKKLPEKIVPWFRQNRRDLPWRREPGAYHVWVSEIMLQQTRVEAVKRYYERFLKELPDIQSLAEAKEEKLLKLWEGLGYYNRVRNMQKAAQQIMIDYQGEFPADYEEIRKLKGIGNYTAGAISAFAYGIPKPAVDGNVLRVLSRILADDRDIMKQRVRNSAEKRLEQVIPSDAASDFNQGLIELGAIVCVPNGEPKCGECPAASICQAHLQGNETAYPVKSRAKARRIEKRTVFIFRDGEGTAICKRPAQGLLAGLYELPNIEGYLSQEEAVEYSKRIGLMPVRIKKLEEAKHIFSHVEWHMIGYQVQVDELEKSCTSEMIFAYHEEIEKRYPVPAAFEAYIKYAV